MHGKHVCYADFVKDGVLDEEAFSEAIDAEIKDWVDRGVSTKTSVIGHGFSQKKTIGNKVNDSDMNDLEEDRFDDAWTKEMVGFVQQQPESTQ